MSIKYPTFPSRIKAYEVSSSYVTGSDALFNNLTVSGSSSVINSTNVYFKDNLIEINVGNASNQGAGLYISGSGGDVSLTVVEDGSGLGVNTYVSAADGFIGDGSQLKNVKIGDAEDGNYTDGLFVDFTPTTNIGVAIDRVNAVLKGLAPSSAPDLTNLERNVSVGDEMKLSFGASNSINNYINVTASLGVLLPNVNFTNTFSPSTIPNGGGGTNRMGVFSSITALTLLLNNQVVSDYGAYVNYPDNAFNVSTDGIGTYTLEVNDSIVSVASTNNDNFLNQNNFSLSAASVGKFVGSGEVFNLFKHRTGTVTIPNNTWRLGHNYAKVTFTSTLGTKITNYVDWVYDPASKNGGGEDYYFTNSDIRNSSPSGQKFLSGIKYYTNYNYSFHTEINNFYKNTYRSTSNGGITFSNLSNGLGAAPVSVPVPLDESSIIDLYCAHSVSSVRVLSASVGSTLNINNNLGKTATLNLNTDKLLLDGVNTPNTDLIENFCLENYRGVNNNYDSQTSADSSLNSFPSASNLTTSDLVVYSGGLRYPTKILNNGNVLGSGIQIMYNDYVQPNYSSFNGSKYYYRIFKNGISSRPIIKVIFTINNTNFITHNDTLSSNNLKAWIKIPEYTGWRDIIALAPTDTSTIPFVDNVGARIEDPIISGNTIAYNVSFASQALLPNNYFILKLEANDTWNGYLNKIEIANYNS
jgi:hypothetical protein